MVEVIDAESFSALLHVSRETMERLTVYESLLHKWQKSINLVSPASLSALWSRHMLDSAQLVELAPTTAKCWMDIGSGGGFPGMVVAIIMANNPEFHMNLVESDSRKSIFLREVARLTGAPVTVHTARIEELSSGLLQPDVISARALASMSQLLGYSAPFFRQGTTGLFLKGAGYAEELTDARKDWIFSSEAFPSRSDKVGVVLKIQGQEDGTIKRRNG